MKPFPFVRPLAFSALLALAPASSTLAQSGDPSPTIAPSKPAAEVAASAPSVTAAASPSPTATPEATPAKRTPEEKKARKADRLKKYDTNHDGKLDKKEKAAMRADMGLTPITDESKASPTP